MRPFLRGERTVSANNLRPIAKDPQNEGGYRLGLQVTKSHTDSEKFETADGNTRRDAEIYVLRERSESLSSVGDFQSVDDIVDRITERAHRVAGY